MNVEAGTTLLHYRLLEKIGEGGMGVVFKAEDGRLDRRVAIKILPEGLAHNPERLARFEREAKVLASLNHPHIAAIHGLERQGGVHFLVLELVPGESLAARLARGPLPPREAIEVCAQIARALEAAHDKGIIHRDLKPANVAITPEGMVKVLDFGLAKAFETGAPESSRSISPTRTSGGTGEAVILGTAAYMSPEQARGKPVDKRSDIWSFGCVLYEALTGRQAFPGETVSDCIAKILERDPDWRSLPERTPARARDLLRRCLRKDLASRLRDIGDARIEMEEILAAPSEGNEAASGVTGAGGAAMAAAAGPGVAARFGIAGLAAIGIGGALLGAALVRLAGGGAAPGSVAEGPAIAEVARITHDVGISEWPTWSPDGSLVAFASNRSGDFEIYVRRLEGGQEVNVTNDPAQDIQPAFSPDGTTIAFISTRSSRTGLIKIGTINSLEFRTVGGDLWLVPSLGGKARRLGMDANYPAWRPDGSRVAYVSGIEEHRSIQEIAPDGTAPRAVLPTEASRWEIARLRYAPHGAWISFENADGSVWLIPSSGGTPRRLLDGVSHVWDTSGRGIYYLSRAPLGGTRLFRQDVDEGRGEAIGAPQSLGIMTGLLRELDASGDGRHIAFAQFEGSINLTRLPLAPGGGAAAGPEEAISTGQVIDRNPSYSADGRRIAFTSDRLGGQETWVLDLATRRQERLLLPGKDAGQNYAQWSPDGSMLAITRFFEHDAYSVWMAALDGSRAEEVVPPAQGLYGADFSPDGKVFLYTARADGVKQLFLLDVGRRARRQLTASPGDKYDGSWSPDGRWIVYSSNQGGSVQIWRVPAAGGAEEQLTHGDERMRHAFFSPDGRWLYVQPSHRNIYRMPAAGGPLQPVTAFPEAGLFIEEPTISPDGRWLLYCRGNGGSSLWLLTLASAAPGP